MYNPFAQPEEEQEYMRLPDGRIQPIPKVELPVESIPEPEPEPVARVDPNADLFEVPQPDDNDIRTDHLFETEGMGDISGLDDDLSDLFDTSPPEEPRPPKRYRINPKYRRTFRREPPASMGGVRY